MLLQHRQPWHEASSTLHVSATFGDKKNYLKALIFFPSLLEISSAFFRFLIPSVTTVVHLPRLNLGMFGAGNNVTARRLC
jgi:hypothetical protein